MKCPRTNRKPPNPNTTTANCVAYSASRPPAFVATTLVGAESRAVTASTNCRFKLDGYLRSSLFVSWHDVLYATALAVGAGDKLVSLGARLNCCRGRRLADRVQLTGARVLRTVLICRRRSGYSPSNVDLHSL